MSWFGISRKSLLVLVIGGLVLTPIVACGTAEETAAPGRGTRRLLHPPRNSRRSSNRPQAASRLPLRPRPHKPRLPARRPRPPPLQCRSPPGRVTP